MIPGAENAIIEHSKLTWYLLNPDHARGGSKARLLLAFGYRRDSPETLERDLREQHLSLDAVSVAESPFGPRYHLIGPIVTPSGRRVTFSSIWQIDTGQEAPRLITMYPE